MPEDKPEQKEKREHDRSLQLRLGQPSKTPPGLEKLAAASKAAGEAMRIANPGLEKLAKASNTAGEAIRVADSAALRDVLKPLNEVSKTFMNIQGKSGLAEALKSVDVARDIIGPRPLMEDVRPLGPSRRRWSGTRRGRQRRFKRVMLYTRFPTRSNRSFSRSGAQTTFSSG